MTDESGKLKFYTDKHIPKAVTTQLRLRGVDIIRCEDVGLGDADDPTHLAFATREGRVIITNDDDFIRWHHRFLAEGKHHAGIMFCHSHVQGDGAVGRIVREVLMYHELIEGGAGTVERDITDHLMFVS